MDAADVRLEFVASVEVDTRGVAMFIRELSGVLAHAWYEVRSVHCQPQRAGGREAVLTSALVSCERSVVDVLCQRFGQQARHVSQGELLLVCCRQVSLRAPPTAVSSPHGARRKDAQPDSAVSAMEMKEFRASTALPRTTMVDLLDCLGDHIADVFEAFHAQAVQCESGRLRLSMFGVVQALRKLEKRPTVIHERQSISSTPLSTGVNVEAPKKSNGRAAEDHPNSCDIQRTRHLVGQLAANGAIGQSALPDRNDTPFLVYTDFISCYVAHLSGTNSTLDHFALGSSLKKQ